MPNGSRELTEARREEIIAACEKLYKTVSFKNSLRMLWRIHWKNGRLRLRLCR